VADITGVVPLCAESHPFPEMWAEGHAGKRSQASTAAMAGLDHAAPGQRPSALARRPLSGWTPHSGVPALPDLLSVSADQRPKGTRLSMWRVTFREWAFVGSGKARLGTHSGRRAR
jgi:hypothetical protein